MGRFLEAASHFEKYFVAFPSIALKFGYAMQQTTLSNVHVDEDTVIFNSAHNVRHCLHSSLPAEKIFLCKWC